MSEEVSWQCAYCNHHATVRTSRNHNTDRRHDRYYLARNKHALLVTSIICPNPNCGQLTLHAELRNPKIGNLGNYLWPMAPADGKRINEVLLAKNKIDDWQLLPASNAKPYPDYIPEPIRKDYTEACLVKNLSANAAATLARRCLQGMVRDFHEIERSSLQKEFEAIKDKVEHRVWKAIDEVRKLGAIGAHMEEDVNMMVDVEVDEVEQLIWLIEFLFGKWYVERYEAEKSLAAIPGLAEQKKNNNNEDGEGEGDE